MSAFLDDIQVVGLASESTQGSAASLAATDYFMTEIVKWKPAQEQVARDFKSQSLDQIASIPGFTWWDVDLRIPFKNSGVAATAFAPLVAGLVSTGMVAVTTATNTIVDVTISNGGTGYTSPPVVAFTPTAGGSGATAQAFIAGGIVVSVLITNPGTGYASGATVGFSGGGGTSAAATCSTSGSTFVAATSAPASNMNTLGKSCTLELYKGSNTTSQATKVLMKGCVATKCQLGTLAGKISFLDLSLRGLYTEPTNVSMPTTTYNATVEPIIQSSGLAGHNFQPIAEKVNIDWGITTTVRPDHNSAYGIKAFQLTQRKPTFEWDPELELTSGTNFFNRLTAGTLGNLGFAIGSVAGNRCDVVLPSTQYLSIDPQRRADMIVYNIKGQVNRVTGDDWISFVFS
jgi:hypothetical protein